MKGYRDHGVSEIYIALFNFLIKPLQIASYSENWPVMGDPEASTNASPSVTPTMGDDDTLLNDFHRHCQAQAKANQDCIEDWQSKLRCYLSCIEHDVSEKTDIVEWWQVCYFCSYTTYLQSYMATRTMPKSSPFSPASPLMSFLPRHPPFPVNSFSRQARRQPPIGMHDSAPSVLSNFRY